MLQINDNKILPYLKPFINLYDAGRHQYTKRSLHIKKTDAHGKVKPKYIFFENVPLFMKTEILINNKKVFLKDYLINQLNSRYKINSEMVDMSKHSVPQKRVRAIFLMTRKDINRLQR